MAIFLLFATPIGLALSIAALACDRPAHAATTPDRRAKKETAVKDIRVTVTSADGQELYDQFGTNSDQLANERIAWTAQFHPDAQVTRTETPAED